MEKVKIGFIQKPFGIKGEVKVFPLTDFVEERFKKGNEITLNLDGSETELIIESARNHQKSLLIKFEGLDTLNDVEHFHKGEIFMEEGKRHELPAGQYYFSQLVGLDAFSNDISLGKVIEVMDLPAHPVLRINYNDTVVMVPFNDTFIEDLSLEDNKIIIKWMEGLF